MYLCEDVIAMLCNGGNTNTKTSYGIFNLWRKSQTQPLEWHVNIIAGDYTICMCQRCENFMNVCQLAVRSDYRVIELQVRTLYTLVKGMTNP